MVLHGKNQWLYICAIYIALSCKPTWLTYCFIFFQMCDTKNLLQTHVTGVMLHGIRTFMFIDNHEWPHDSNWTMNCLLYALTKEFQTPQKLPPTIYIQLDNCGRENKNKYFLAMMMILVKKGIMKEVLMSFLMVGHTHEGERQNVC